MQSYNPAIPGCTFSRLLNAYGRWARKQEKCWQTMLLLLLLEPSVRWLSIVTYNDAKPLPKWILRAFDVSRIRPG